MYNRQQIEEFLRQQNVKASNFGILLDQEEIKRDIQKDLEREQRRKEEMQRELLEEEIQLKRKKDRFINKKFEYKVLTMMIWKELSTNNIEKSLGSLPRVLLKNLIVPQLDIRPFSEIKDAGFFVVESRLSVYEKHEIVNGGVYYFDRQKTNTIFFKDVTTVERNGKIDTLLDVPKYHLLNAEKSGINLIGFRYTYIPSDDFALFSLKTTKREEIHLYFTSDLSEYKELIKV